MSMLFLAALSANSAVADRPLDWVELGCPKAVASESCSYTNNAIVDMAVSLFFQVEDSSRDAFFKCQSAKQTHCRRSWGPEEQGSAGTCFFLLGAGESFSCDGQGTVNVIGAHGIQLADKFLSDAVQTIPCESSSCVFSSQDTDQWVEMVFKSPDSSQNSIQCTVDDHTVCLYKTQNSASELSCSTLLPQGKELKCETSAGAPTIVSAVARGFQNNLGPVGTPKTETCPPESSDVSLCDCSYSNDGETDLLVSISAGNGDGVFNSFHCYVWGANICAWGANNGENGATGQCNFILPAGADYTCELEWGATAFPAVSVLPLSKSIFKSSQLQTLHYDAPSRGVRMIPTTRSSSDMARLWKEFQTKHGQISHEKFENFQNYVALVDQHPTNPPLHFGHELSPLAVLTKEEFEANYRGCAKTHQLQPSVSSSSAEVQAVLSQVESIDWRDLGSVTPVKDQGQCGSCWAFSTTGALEGAWAAAGHGLLSLSEQQLVSCDNLDGNAGCGGGWPYLAIEYVAEHGIDTEDSYPYNSGSGTAPSCAASSGTRAQIQVTNYTAIEPDEDAMAAWVAKNGPLSISIDAMTSIWWSYTGGIVDGCCNTALDHAVLIVGFGSENGQKYWLVKNSWGESWGENGYIRLERGSNQCGITVAAVGALVSGSPSPVPPSPQPTPTPSPVPQPPSPSPVPQPPSPSPYTCPPDAQVETSSGAVECVWKSGSGLTIPQSARQYCNYISSGYIGYTWDVSAGDYDCAPSARKSSNGATNFCVWEDGSLDVVIPSGSVADCDSLSSGRVGFYFPVIHFV